MLCFVLLFTVAFAGDITVKYKEGTFTESADDGICKKKYYDNGLVYSVKVSKKSKVSGKAGAEKYESYILETKYWNNDNCKDEPVHIDIDSKIDQTTKPKYEYKKPEHIAIYVPCGKADCSDKDDNFKYRDGVTFFMKDEFVPALPTTSVPTLQHYSIEGEKLMLSTKVYEGDGKWADEVKTETGYKCGSNVIENELTQKKTYYYLECGAMSVFVSIIALFALFLF